MKIKKTLALVLVFSMLLTMLGCMTKQVSEPVAPAAAETADAPKVEEAVDVEPSGTVEFWTFYSPGTVQSDLYDEIVADFNTAYPNITVNITYVGQDIVTQIRPTFASKTPPDIFLGNTGLGGTLAEEGVVAPVNEYLAGMDLSGDKVWSDTFINGAIQAGCVLGDDIYMIPNELAISAWFYNKGLFSELGISVPTTWAEMMATCQSLSDAGVASIGADGNVDIYLSWFFTNLAIRSAGHDTYLAALRGETSWNSPEFLKATKDLQALLPYFQDGMAGTQYPGANALFVQGQAAMMYVGSWLPQEILSIMPEGFELGMFEWPNYNPDDTKMVEVKCNGMFIPVDAKNPDAAIVFAKYFTSKDVAEKISSTLSTHTATIGATQPEKLSNLTNIISSADVTTPQYNYVYQAEFADYSGAVLFPLISQFMFGTIETAESFIEQLDTMTADYYASK